MTTDEEKNGKNIYHYGRGGAGNITVKKADSPSMLPQGTPTLKSKTYTTGRGGTGNMAKNDNPDEARAAQDVDIPAVLLQEGSRHVGRGGAANTYTPSSSEQAEAREHNAKVRTDSFKKNEKERAGIKGLVDKAKDTLAGKN